MLRPSTAPLSDDFEIAIVCLPSEGGEEIQSLLDFEYDDDTYTNAPDDHNVYITGRISRTNVILIPHEVKWTQPPSEDESLVLPTFPNIRVILDVGICGAAPRTKDDQEILVGDAIISHKLWRYKDGKKWPDKITEEDTLQRKLADTDETALKLNSFLRCLSTYHRHAILEDNTTTWMKELLDDPVFDMKDVDRGEDILYPRSYAHRHRIQECNSCTNSQICAESSQHFCDEIGCSVNRATPRNRHGYGKIGTDIHFGTIVQDQESRHCAVVRDELGANTTGAVGFVHGNPGWDIPLPTIFIKGVADYADGHKLEFWHDYAARIAASCLKAFVEGWSPIFGDAVSTPSLESQLSPWDGTHPLRPSVSPVQIRHSFDSTRNQSWSQMVRQKDLRPELRDFTKCLIADTTLNHLLTNIFRQLGNNHNFDNVFAILLRNYALELRNEAQNKIEVGMVDSVFWEAVTLSKYIRRKWTQPSTVNADDVDDAPKYFSMSKIKTFMVDCDPFQQLKIGFDTFVRFGRVPEEIPNGFPADNYDSFTETYGEDCIYTQLNNLGYEPDRVLQLISDVERFSPWIPLEPADAIEDIGRVKQDFHTPGCAHEPLLEGGVKAQIYTRLNRNMLPVDIRHKVERTCGLAGIVPIRGNEQEWFEETRFSGLQMDCVEVQLGRNSTPSWRRDSLGSRLIDIMDRCVCVLSWAQANMFCCDSYTTLRIDRDVIEIVEIPFKDVYQLYVALFEYDNTSDAQQAIRTRAKKLLDYFYGENFAELIRVNSKESDAIDAIATIAAQSCSLSILLYFHAHCGPLKMSILTQEVRTIILRCHGLRVKPRVRTVWLSCIGDMLKKPVMAFSVIAPVTSTECTTFDLRGTLRNIIYTWGPARILAEPTAKSKSPQVVLVWMQDGTISTSPQAPHKLHWSKGHFELSSHAVSFGLDDIIVVAGTFTNSACPAGSLVLSNTRARRTAWETELTLMPDSTQGMSRQLEFCNGKHAIYLTHATSILVPGTTVKDAIVRDFGVLNIRDSDLEGNWGLRVSFCSGVCERVSLRTTLAENVGLFGSHCILALEYMRDWHELVTTLDLRGNLGAAKQDVWRSWYAALSSHHRSILDDAMSYTVSRLRSTGYVAGKFIIAKPNFDDVSRCIKIPCDGRYLWMKALADDEHCATFAYFTSKCLERLSHFCEEAKGSGHSCRNNRILTWNSATVGLDTTLSFQPSSESLGLAQEGGSLKNGKFYAIGKPELSLCALVTCGSCRGTECSSDCVQECSEKHLIIRKWRLPGKLKQILAEYCRLTETRYKRVPNVSALVLSSQKPPKMVNGVNGINGTYDS